MIVFSNPGEIDPRLISTLGVNVKDNDSAIGFFGTGLKYAIAVCLREAQVLEIWSGLTKYEFLVSPETIRGKEFGFIAMRHCHGAGKTDILIGPWVPLGFTTDLGKTWTIANAYRELHCNCLDEGGHGGTQADFEPSPGFTHVVVRGMSFEDVHRERHTFLLRPDLLPLYRSPRLEVYMGPCKKFFYRGIAVCDLPRPSLMTYNVLEPVALTEDRTVKSTWDYQQRLAGFYNTDAPEALIRTAFSTKTDTVEASLPLSWFDNPSKAFCSTLEDLMATMRKRVPDNAAEHWLAKSPKRKAAQWTPIKLSGPQAKALRTAISFCARIGFDIEAEIKVTRGLDDETVGCVRDGVIWLSERALADPDFLASTLIEEHIHIDRRVRDETRAMQNVLFSEIVRLGRRLITSEAL